VIHIGFTGTRHGMSEEQRIAVDVSVCDLIGGDLNLRVHAHHGDCVGADAQFHKIATDYGCKTVGHPPWGRTRRAFCAFDEVRSSLPFLERNRAIVSESNFMLAAPLELEEQPRGGTWHTIRLTRKVGKPLAIVWRDGRVTKERWP